MGCKSNKRRRILETLLLLSIVSLISTVFQDEVVDCNLGDQDRVLELKRREDILYPIRIFRMSTPADLPAGRFSINGVEIGTTLEEVCAEFDETPEFIKDIRSECFPRTVFFGESANCFMGWRNGTEAHFSKSQTVTRVSGHNLHLDEQQIGQEYSTLDEIPYFEDSLRAAQARIGPDEILRVEFENIGLSFQVNDDSFEYELSLPKR